MVVLHCQGRRSGKTTKALSMCNGGKSGIYTSSTINRRILTQEELEWKVPMQNLYEYLHRERDRSKLLVVDEPQLFSERKRLEIADLLCNIWEGDIHVFFTPEHTLRLETFNHLLGRGSKPTYHETDLFNYMKGLFLFTHKNVQIVNPHLLLTPSFICENKMSEKL